MQKILYFDVETTGLDPNKNDITQFAAIVEIDGVVKEEVNWRCQPLDWKAVDEEALKITGVSLEELKTFQTPDKMFHDMARLFAKYIDKFDKNDKFYPAGHNVGFDLEFLQQFWIKNGSVYGTGSYQNWRTLDSRAICNFLSLKGIIPCKDIKLKTLCDYFGIEIQAHDALSDIRATRLLIKKVMEYMKL